MLTHRIYRSVLNQYLQHADESPDNEIIGALSGQRSENVWTSDKYSRIKNLARERSTHPAFKMHHSKEYLNSVVDFVPDPNEWFSYLQSIKIFDKDAQRDHVAITHTHPHSAPIPSRWDIAGSGSANHGLTGFFLIYSNTQKRMTTWFVNEDGTFEEATTEIIEDL